MIASLHKKAKIVFELLNRDNTLNVPEIGIKLENKNNLKSTGLRKIYFNNKKETDARV